MTASAHAQYFIGESATGSGSASASGFSLITGFMTPQSGSFTGVNTGITEGNHSQVWADANNTLTITPMTLTATVQGDGNWVDSSAGIDSEWTPTANSSATLNVSFQVAVTGAYKIDVFGAGPFTSSQDVSELMDSASVTGISGGNTVLSLSMNDGESWTTPGSDLFTLTTSTEYSLKVSNSVGVGSFFDNPAVPQNLQTTLTVTAVPEPAATSLLLITSGTMLSRRRGRKM
jgi:hypothetical protein